MNDGLVGAGWVLAQSADFTVRAEYEVVWLESSRFAGALVIGDFYGDPAGAAIDSTQRWCVVVGRGVLAYRLSPPWLPAGSPPDTADPSWWEDNEEARFDQVRSHSDGTFVCSAGPYPSDRIMTVASVDPDRHQITTIARVTDRAALERTEMMASLLDGELLLARGDHQLGLVFRTDNGEAEVEISAGFTSSFPLPEAHWPRSVPEVAAKLLAEHLGWTVLQARADSDGSLVITLIPPSVPGRSLHPPPQVLLNAAAAPSGAWRLRTGEHEIVSPAAPWEWEPTAPPGDTAL